MDDGESSYSRFLAGDDDVIDDIVKAYSDGLTYFINGFVHDIELSQQIAQDTFVKLFLKRPVNRRTASFKTWLYSIGRNTAIDYLRKAKKEKTVTLEEVAFLPSTDNVEKVCFERAEKTMIYEAVERLKPEYSQVLYLTYFEEMSNKQTAIIMKKSLRSVENLIARAKKSLKKELEKGGFIYENT